MTKYDTNPPFYCNLACQGLCLFVIGCGGGGGGGPVAVAVVAEAVAVVVVVVWYCTQV